MFKTTGTVSQSPEGTNTQGKADVQAVLLGRDGSQLSLTWHFIDGVGFVLSVIMTRISSTRESRVHSQLSTDIFLSLYSLKGRGFPLLGLAPLKPLGEENGMS